MPRGLLRPNVAGTNDSVVPNVAERTTEARTSNPRYLILLLVGGSALVRFAAGMGMRYDTKTGKSNDRNLARSGLEHTPIFAFIAVYVVLAMAADFDATRDLAVVFSLLLFVTMSINYGSSTANNLTNVLNHQPSFKPVPVTGPDRKV